MTMPEIPQEMPESEYPREPDQFFGFDTLVLPQTHRFGSPEMRQLWSQNNIWSKVRSVWIAGAEVQAEVGLVSPEEVAELREHRYDVSVPTIFAIERQRGHDIIAAQHEYAQVAPNGAKKIHNGFTSEDPLSAVETEIIHESLDLTRERVVNLLSAFVPQIRDNKDLACVGWTHLQAAEPTTYGYRNARYAQDFLKDLGFLDWVIENVKGKGIKGPVGTYGSIGSALRGTKMSPREHEQKIMDKLGQAFDPVSGQSYARKNLLLVEMALGGIAQSLHVFANDMYMLQSSAVGEVREPRRRNQDFSSSMPHKRNPVRTENILSLTEEFPGYMTNAWQVATSPVLERSLADSASKRGWLPMSFADIDHSLMNAEALIKGLTINKKRVKANLDKFAPFFANDEILASLTNAGMDRKAAHELLQGLAHRASEVVDDGEPNPFIESVMEEGEIIDLLGKEMVQTAFDKAATHYGEAADVCDDFLDNYLIPAITPQAA